MTALRTLTRASGSMKIYVSAERYEMEVGENVVFIERIDTSPPICPD
jgi:hypothetical protein